MKKETENKIIEWLNHLTKYDNQDLLNEYNEDPIDFYCGNEDDAKQLGEDLAYAEIAKQAQKLLNLIKER